VELSATRPATSSDRLRAIELELDRAVIALDDLQGVQRADPEGALVDVEGWLRDSVEAWRPVALRRGATLHLEWRGPAARVRGARPRLAQATGNLIANAVEHGGGRVAVRGRVEGERVLISVRDDGPGIGPELATWLERPLRGRARRRRGSVPGRGQGLLIARTVAAAHGGRLTAEPSECGACLVLELPLAGLGGRRLCRLSRKCTMPSR
jgi:signal transduction histidine kinase